MLLPSPLSALEGLMPRAYVRQIYCFASTDPHAAVKDLEKSLIVLAQDAPYLLSRVVGTKSAGLRLKLSEQLDSPEDLLSWQDTSDLISYDEIKLENFPPGAFLAPGIVPPETQPPYPDEPPVFRARVSVVRGGLFLCVAVHHSTTDITGFGSLLKLWSQHCRGCPSLAIGQDDAFTNRALLRMKADTLLPASKDAPAIPDLLHFRSAEDMPGGVGPDADMKTVIFYFPLGRLRLLKDAVCKQLGPGRWASTGDVLSALLWAAVVKAEGLATHESKPDDQGWQYSTLSFPVQFRGRIRIPHEYLGAAFLMTNAMASHDDLSMISESRDDSADDALARVALGIRRSIEGVNDEVVRSVLTFLEAHSEDKFEDPLVLGPPRKTRRGTGASVVSWADQEIYKLDWGQFMGRCEAVRLPKMGYKRHPIVFPRIPTGEEGLSRNGNEGGLEVIVSFEDKVMQHLIAEPVMKRWAVLRCIS